MNLELNFENTKVVFSIKGIGVDDCGYYWPDTKLTIENKFFHYDTDNFLELSEIKLIYNKLTALLNNEIAKVDNIEFLEPDIQIEIKPQIHLIESGKYEYCAKGYEIEDITVRISCFLFLDGLSAQYYSLTLYRDEIIQLVEFFKEYFSKYSLSE